MRTDVLKQIHEGHLGVSKCRLRAKTSVYWPCMNGEIEDIVGQCEKTLISVAILSTPWTKIGVDLCELNKNTI